MTQAPRAMVVIHPTCSNLLARPYGIAQRGACVPAMTLMYLLYGMHAVVKQQRTG